MGFDEKHKTVSNTDGIEKTIGTIKELGTQDAFVWVNLVDFDQEYGHRNDPAGFAKCLEEFDNALPIIIEALPHESVLVLTADHGNDPTYPGTDHTREHVPLLVFDGRNGRGLGNRSTFSDHAASVLDYFKVASPEIAGESFLRP